MKRFLTVVFFTFTMSSVLTTLSYGEALVHVVFPQTTPIAVGKRLNVDIQIADAQGVVGMNSPSVSIQRSSAVLGAGMRIIFQRVLLR